MRELKKAGGLVLSLTMVGCGLVMFLAGTDVWHDLGRPGFWGLPAPPYPDVRVFVGSYYVLMLLVLIEAAVRVVGVLGGSWKKRPLREPVDARARPQP